MKYEGINDLVAAENQDLEEQVKTLNAEVETLNAQVKQLPAEMGKLEGEIMALEERVVNLECKVTSVTNEVEQLKDKLGKLVSSDDELLLGELCWRIQSMIFKNVLPPSEYYEAVGYNLKYIEDDIDFFFSIFKTFIFTLNVTMQVKTNSL